MVQLLQADHGVVHLGVTRELVVTNGLERGRLALQHLEEEERPALDLELELRLEVETPLALHALGELGRIVTQVTEMTDLLVQEFDAVLEAMQTIAENGRAAGQEVLVLRHPADRRDAHDVAQPVLGVDRETTILGQLVVQRVELVGAGRQRAFAESLDGVLTIDDDGKDLTRRSGDVEGFAVHAVLHPGWGWLVDCRPGWTTGGLCFTLAQKSISEGKRKDRHAPRGRSTGQDDFTRRSVARVRNEVTHPSCRHVGQSSRLAEARRWLEAPCWLLAGRGEGREAARTAELPDEAVMGCFGWAEGTISGDGVHHHEMAPDRHE